MKKKNKVTVVLFCLIFLIGLLVLLYPMFSNLWNERRSAQLIAGYREEIAQVPQEDDSKWFEEADAYNKTLEGKGVPDAFAFISEEEDEEYLAQLAFREDGVMGYIEIPKISVSLPIYHTTSEEVLQKGAGHLQGSALPVGGAGTHCVISAHRGLPSAAMFTDLNMLKIGDHFYIYVLDRVLAYEVDQIKEVEPEDTEALDVDPEKDLVTLVTCTPYGVNTQRLLVRGHRVEYEEETAQKEAEETVSSMHTRYGIWVASGLGFTALFSVFMYLWTRRGSRKKRGERKQ